MSLLGYIVLGIHSVLAVLIIVLVLLHSGKGGVSGIFGGGMRFFQGRRDRLQARCIPEGYRRRKRPIGRSDASAYRRSKSAARRDDSRRL